MKQKYSLVNQDEIKDCGPACIATIVKYYNGYIPLEEIKNMCHTTKKGTTALDIVLTLEKIGFKSQGVKIDFEQLKNNKITFPCIAHVTLNGTYNHYLVIYKIKNKYLIIGDPKDKIKKISTNNFEQVWNNIIITACPRKIISKYKFPKRLFIKYILKTLNDYKKNLILIISLSNLIILFIIIISFNMQYMVDGVNNQKSIDYFLFGFSFFLITFIIKAICDYLRNKLLTSLNNKIDLKITSEVFEKIIYLPYHYYHNKTTGEIISKIKDLNKVKQIIIKVALTLFLDLPLTILSLIILINLNETLALIAIIIMLGYLGLIIHFKPNYEKHIDNLQKRNADINTYMIENIQAFKTIKGLNIETNIVNYFNQKYQTLINDNQNFEQHINHQYFFKELINNIGPLIIITVGCILIMDKQLTLGQLMSFNALLIYFLSPIKNLVDLDTNYKEARNALRRIDELLIEPKKYSNKNALTKGKINFKQLNFSFNNRDLILKNINFKIKAGKKVLLIGKSGSGKSTLCSLLMKYYTIAEEQIFLDDIDINELANTRKDITYISQNELLFTDTLYNNLALGRQIDNNQFLKIAKMCEIDKLINDNIGYNQIIEENGFNLSGGEKQRIFLGRALLKKFTILIIDEGLSELDQESERRILKRIFNAFPNKTIIVISHRLVNKDLFDQIIKLKKGRLHFTNQKKG